MIASNYIRDYLIKKFEGKFKLISSGRELIIPSVFFTSDSKRHMSINLETGLWQCFKSGEKGNFIHLYALLESISYKAAYRKFLVDEFFAEQEFKTVKEDYQKGQASEEIDPEFKNNFRLVEAQRDGDDLNSLATLFLIDRGIYGYGKFYYAVSGLYKGRLIIPYQTNERVYFFQARSLVGQYPKYLNFRGMKSSSILYPFDYDSTKPLYICEGALDAMSLQICGLNATTTISCHVSRAQLDQLRYYNGPLVVAYDNDKAGNDGLRSFEILRRKARLPHVYYCFPPAGYKDWNESFVGSKESTLLASSRLNKFNLLEWDTMGGLDY